MSVITMDVNMSLSSKITHSAQHMSYTSLINFLDVICDTISLQCFEILQTRNAIIWQTMDLTKTTKLQRYNMLTVDLNIFGPIFTPIKHLMNNYL